MSSIRRIVATAVSVAVLACAVVVATGDVRAGDGPFTVVVNNAGDLGVGGCTKDECTFREAINLMNGTAGKTIKFDPAVFPPDDETDIVLWSAPPKIGGTGITIDGSGTGEVIAGYESADGGTALEFVTGLGEVLRDVSVLDVEFTNWTSAAIRFCPGSAGPFCTFHARNIEISGVTIRESVSTSVIAGGIDYSDVTIDGLTIDGTFTQGVPALSFDFEGVAQDLAIRESVIGPDGGGGFRLNAMAFENLEVTGNLLQGGMSGLSLAGDLADVLIADNQFIGVGLNIHGEPGSSNSVTLEGNTVTGSPYEGMLLSFGTISDLVIAGNSITDSTFTGIWLVSESGGTVAEISDNIISQNGQDPSGARGIWIHRVPAVIDGNQVFDNSRLGIDLYTETDPPNGVTPNDAGDADSFGDNPLLNFPVVTSSDSQEVRGTACDGCIVQLFLSDEDPTGYGEGEEFLAQATANAAGQFAVPICGLSLMAGTSITTTATLPNVSTSEFSLNFELEEATGSCPTPTPTPSPTGTPAPTPTGTPTSTPGGPTPTPTPSPAPGDHVMGDNDCDGDVDSVDALASLRHTADLPVNQQPGCPALGKGVSASGAPQLFGDTDCDGDVDAVDALRILRHVAALPVSEPKGCPTIGSPVQ